MKTEFRHAYLQYVAVHVGGYAICIDYELTVYWGTVISIDENGLVTLRYYAGEGVGYKRETFHPYRCIGDPYDEIYPQNGHLRTRYSVVQHFQHYTIPRLKAFPERYAEVQSVNDLIRKGADGPLPVQN